MMLQTFTETPFQLQLSFYQMIENLEKRVGADDGPRSAADRQLLQELEQAPELRNWITNVSQIEDNEELIGRLLSDYFPADLTLNEIKAISIPYVGVIFNHTQRFKNILKAAGPDFDINIRDLDEHQFYVTSCCLILNEIYGTRLDISRPLFYDIPAADGTVRHYRLLYNADFLDIIPTPQSLPISAEDIDRLINNYDDLALWKEKFPQGSWIMKGFAIMSLFDATVENAVSILKENLLGLNTTMFHKSMQSVFQSIYRIPDLDIGFSLYNEEEGTLSVDVFGEQMNSFILPGDLPGIAKEMLCAPSYKRLVTEKVYFAVSDTSRFYDAYPESKLAKNFIAKGIQSFILAPVVKNQQLLGVLEIVSPRTNELHSVNAHKLEVVMPYMTDSIERLIAEFQNQIQAVIQNNYTSIHNSVYWRFRKEAYRFIEAHQRGNEYSLQEVVFKDVYPLYGQIDIKGSSEARNLSVQKDLKAQLNALAAVLEACSDLHVVHKEREQILLFIGQLDFAIPANLEQYIDSYLERLLHPHLKEITDTAYLSAINTYFIECDKEHGQFYKHRRKYETTIYSINEKMAHILDKRQIEAQLIFPHYYERFKTDGVEHNLYIGASVSPDRSFSVMKFHKIRLWQLQVLCEMEIAHHSFKNELPYALDVTTLILAYHSTISIRFRMDEKRFDVDGSYNARFEIVKKRIDKAHIKNTSERITESGKLTIVYLNDGEEKEYLKYIQQLQHIHLLEDNIEKFEIEDLQGIAGLKGLRVTIIHKEA